MRLRPTTLPTLAMAVLCLGRAEAQSLLSAPSNAAVAACERAAREALSSSRGPAADVSFNAPPAAQPAPADAGEQVLRGAGRVRSAAGARGFTYSCNVNPNTGVVSGVVVRDQATATETPAARGGATEPDLSRVSPQACESAAAVALKRRWPNVDSIQFDSATRALQQASVRLATLRGQGQAKPFSTAPVTHFAYRCDLDPRDGRVIEASVQD